MKLLNIDLHNIPPSLNTSYPSSNVTCYPWKYSENKIAIRYRADIRQQVERNLIFLIPYITDVKRELVNLRYFSKFYRQL